MSVKKTPANTLYYHISLSDAMLNGSPEMKTQKIYFNTMYYFWPFKN